nr:hypothetical protein A4A49_09147 [Ipomoea trifida]
MGLHLLLIGKLHLFKATSHCLSSVSFLLLGPFVLKLVSGLKPIRQVCHEIVYSLRLFFFQMGEITFNAEPGAAAQGGGGGARWQRALRLVCERLTRARHPQFLETDEESLLDLSMIAL